MRRSTGRYVAWALVAASLMAAPPARAEIFLSYDLDALVLKSAVLVEGEIVGLQEAPDHPVEVRVTHVYRGTVKEGDTLVVAAGIYQKPNGEVFGAKHLEVGDRLFWCLSNANPVPPVIEAGGPRPQKDIVWRVLPGGARLIVDGRVVSFSQHYMTPGPVVAELEEQYARAGNQPPLTDFRNTIETLLVTGPAFEKQIATATAARDSAKLLGLLRERAAARPERSGIDMLSSEALQALAALHDPSTTDAAMQEFHQTGLLREGFGSQQGLAYLLARIMDPALPTPLRIQYISALPRPSEMRREALNIRPPAHVALAFAQRAAATDDRQLADALLAVVGGVAREQAYLDDQGRADLMDAIAVLRAMDVPAADAERKNEIEQITWEASPGAYAQLASPCGQVISRALLPADLHNVQKPEGRDFIASLLASGAFPDLENHRVTTTPWLQGADGVIHPCTYPVSGGFNPSVNTMSAGSSGGFSSLVRPPVDLPAGTYQFFFRFSEAGKALGQSYAVPLSIPQ